MLSLDSEIVMPMTSEAVRATILATYPDARNITAAVESYANSIPCSPVTLWRYLENGVPARAPLYIARHLEKNAKKHGVQAE